MTLSQMSTSLGYTLGPIPIPRRRQIAQNLHRFLSIKAGMRVVTCESKLEADYLFSLEGDPDVVWICDQPLRIDRPIGKRPWYTLDAAFRTRDGNEVLVEVKPASNLKPSATSVFQPPNWEEIKAACREFGREVRFVTDVDLETQVHLVSNWRTLLPFAVTAYDDTDDELISSLEILAKRPQGFELRESHASFPGVPEHFVTAHIALMLHRGLLVGPLQTSPICPRSTIRWNDDGDQE